MRSRLAKILLALWALLGLAACGDDNLFDSVMSSNSSCSTEAIKNKFIVHYKNGSWLYTDEIERADFIESVVKPKFSQIDFVEYDQKIHVDQAAAAPTPSGAVINNWGAQAINAATAW